MTLAYANIPGGLALQDNIRLHRLRLSNERLVGTASNRTLKEINSNRGFPSSGGSYHGGSGLPEAEAYEEARMTGNIVGGSKMFQSNRMIGGMKRMTKAEMKARSKELGHLYGSELMKTDGELQEMKGSGNKACMNEFKKAFMKSLAETGPHMSTSKDDDSELDEDVDVEVLPKKGRGMSGGRARALERGLFYRPPDHKPFPHQDNSHFHNPYLKHSEAEAEAVSGGSMSGGAMSGGKKKRAVSSKMKRRGAMVSKLMREKGMTLGQASSYISKNNLI